MAFFSNHSYRVNPASSTTSSTSNHTTSTTTSTNAQTRPRPTFPPSKLALTVSTNHAATSAHSSGGVSSGEEKEKKERLVTVSTTSNVGDVPRSVHPLRHTWFFWFRQHRAPGNKITNYEEGIKKIGGFGSIESFWTLWTHLNPPSSLQPTTDYLLFHSDVRRPVWEDPLNISGGKWIIRLRKGVADRLWEDIVLAIIGDQFSTDGEPGTDSSEDTNEICGCTISVRPVEDIISVWNKSADPKCIDRVRETIRRVLNLPPTTIMDYKTNNDSINDKSSFRNPTFDRLPLAGVSERPA